MGAPPSFRPVSDYALSTPVGRELQVLFDELTAARPWRLTATPFPLIVLEAQDPAADPGGYLEALQQAAAEAGIPHIFPDLGPDDPEAEFALLDALSEHRDWNVGRGFGRYRFPRSDLIRSLEEAVHEATRSTPADPQRSASALLRERTHAALRHWNDNAALFPWSRGPFTAPVWWSTVGVSVATVLAVLFGGIAQGLADKAQAPLLLTVTGVLVVLILGAVALMTRMIWLPILSRAGFGTRYRWFAASSFFAVLGGQGFNGRLERVLRRMIDDPEGEYRLQVKTFAFLEDLDAAHRRLSPTLRGFKRPVPPVVFLRDITAGNGGVELLWAMSDIRSRRSELHPLLVLASVDHAHRTDLDAPTAPSSQETTGSLRDRYYDWEADLGTAQAPSQRGATPWLLRVPVPAEEPSGRAAAPLPRRRRPRWTWLWSTPSLIAALIVVAAGGLYLNAQLKAAHCRVRFPFSANVDTVLRTDTNDSRECVGVATDGVRFERGSRSTALDGDRLPPDPSHRAGKITLTDLQRRIDAENASVLRSHNPYVTVLYAGILTTAEGHEQSAVSSIQELSGAYLAQLRNNHADLPGGVGYRLKVRLLPVNVGENMSFAGVAIDRVLAIARRDPTVVGVVGMNRNTDRSQAAIRRLNDAGLAVVDTVNSSDRLPELPQYYGLASTDHDEAVVAAYAARSAFDGRRIDRAMLVSRSPGRIKDQYSTELAADAQGELKAARPFALTYDDAGDVVGRVKAVCEGAAEDPFQLVYFAGRAEDLPGLLSGLTQGGCTDHPLTLIGGDELSRASFGSGPHQILLPASLTVYYTTFTYLPEWKPDDAFFILAGNVLGIGAADRSLLENGHAALGYDAASALAQAAQNAFDRLALARAGAHVPGSRSITSASVLLELPRLVMREGATGTIDFTSGRQHARNGPGNRGLTLVRVVVSGGRPVASQLCGRQGGGLPVGRMPRCP